MEEHPAIEKARFFAAASRSAAVEYEEDDDGLDDIERGLLELIVEPDRAATVAAPARSRTTRPHKSSAGGLGNHLSYLNSEVAQMRESRMHNEPQNSEETNAQDDGDVLVAVRAANAEWRRQELEALQAKVRQQKEAQKHRERAAQRRLKQIEEKKKAEEQARKDKKQKVKDMISAARPQKPTHVSKWYKDVVEEKKREKRHKEGIYSDEDEGVVEVEEPLPPIAPQKAKKQVDKQHKNEMTGLCLPALSIQIRDPAFHYQLPRSQQKMGLVARKKNATDQMWLMYNSALSRKQKAEELLKANPPPTVLGDASSYVPSSIPAPQLPDAAMLDKITERYNTFIKTQPELFDPCVRPLHFKRKIPLDDTPSTKLITTNDLRTFGLKFGDSDRSADVLEL